MPPARLPIGAQSLDGPALLVLDSSDFVRRERNCRCARTRARERPPTLTSGPASRAAPTPTFGASCALCVHRPSIRCGRDSRPWVAPQCARVSGPAWLIPSPGRYHHAIQSRQLQGQCLRRVRANEAVRAQSSLRPGRFVCPQLDRANLRFGPPESNVRSANPPPRVQGALLRRQSIGCL